MLCGICGNGRDYKTTQNLQRHEKAAAHKRRVDVGLCKVDGDFYECERDRRRGLPRSSASPFSSSGVVGRPAHATRGPPPQVSVAPALRTPCATTPERGLRAKEGRPCAYGCERKKHRKIKLELSTASTNVSRLKHVSRCHFSFPTAKSTSSPRSPGGSRVPLSAQSK